MEKALFEASDLISENQESVAACLNAARIKEQTNILNGLTIANKYFTTEDIKRWQIVEYWIFRVKEFLQQPTRLPLGVEEVNQNKYNTC